MTPSLPDETQIRTEILLPAKKQGIKGDLEDHLELASVLDSMQRLALVVAIEDHFLISFAPEDDERAVTLSDVVEIVRAHCLAKQHA